MNKPFPSIEPYKTELLEVSNIHSLYLEQSGNPHGKPIISLHGGPGAYSKPDHRRFFDPEKYRIILFDQRGSGKSTPSGEIQENTTQDLIADIERIREHLKIDTWVVSGGSWGSTLALTYAQEHPKSVKALILRGIFLGGKKEMDWANGGARLFYPQEFDMLIKTLGVSKDADIAAYMRNIMVSNDNETKKKAVKAFEIWNSYLMDLSPTVDTNLTVTQELLDSYQVYFHYESHQSFLIENQLLDNSTNIAHIPTAIIQGRYDTCCPPISAWKLHKKLPLSTIDFVLAGHHSKEPAITDKIIEYSNKFSEL